MAPSNDSIDLGGTGWLSTPARAFPRTARPRATPYERTATARVSVPTPVPPEPELPQACEPRERSALLCRALNIVVAVVLLVLTLPISLTIALLIKLTSRGPVFYTQTRVGIDRRWNRAHAMFERRREDLGGEQFTIYKFRSMRVDAEADGQAQWAVQGDPRVTPIGRFIRATRIDELPQLWNVLRGDMNVVGPRPERPSIFVRLREQIDQYPVRQRVRPGITGWAQINRSYDTDVEGVKEKLRLDLQYLERQSFLTDVAIMARTVPVVLFRVGGW